MVLEGYKLSLVKILYYKIRKVLNRLTVTTQTVYTKTGTSDLVTRIGLPNE